MPQWSEGIMTHVCSLIRYGGVLLAHHLSLFCDQGLAFQRCMPYGLPDLQHKPQRLTAQTRSSLVGRHCSWPSLSKRNQAAGAATLATKPMGGQLGLSKYWRVHLCRLPKANDIDATLEQALHNIICGCIGVCAC